MSLDVGDVVNPQGAILKRVQLAERRKTVGLSQESLADLVGVDRSTVVRWERGERAPQPWHRPKLANALKVSVDELAVLLAPVSRSGYHPGQGDLASNLDLQDGDMDRRSFFPMTALPVITGLSAIVELLTPLHRPSTLPTTELDLSLLQADRLTRQAKTLYQACQYRVTLDHLPDLLQGLSQLATTRPADKAHVNVVTADAYHVLASIMLKFGDIVLSTLAGQRAVEAADASGDQIAMACSARIMTHALMSAGHGERAVTLAAAAATSLRRSFPDWQTPAGLAAFGALLLRAAIAAARRNDRGTAQELVAEASMAAHQLGYDGNDRWTGFGPTNVQLHQVHIALTLGDAGMAIHYAKGIDVNKIELAERKACLLTDVAQAYLQWGKQPAALSALEAAYRIAPEEIRSRANGLRICRDLIASSRGPMRDRAVKLAVHAGVHRES